jgi:hypothetical protein
MALNPEDISVESYPTLEPAVVVGPGGGFCCTGCTSGCGINPTAGGCESKDGGTIVADDRYLIAE